MLREIRLYGKLAKFIGQRVLHADVASAAEAIRFLLANWPELERHMANQHYKVCVGDAALDENELAHPIGQQVIKIIPVVAGASIWGSIGKILLGIALVAFAYFAFPAIAAAVLPFTQTAINISYGIAMGLVGIGASIALAGVAGLLTPVPKMGDSNDPRKSYSFSGVQNVSRQGVPCPIVFGEALVGSVVVSAGIDVVQVTA